MKTIAKKCKKPKKTTLFPLEPVPEGPFAPPLVRGKFKLPRLRDRQAFGLSQEGKSIKKMRASTAQRPAAPRLAAKGCMKKSSAQTVPKK